jgi:pilus assembly protein CpaF
MLGFGPLEELLGDPDISDMVSRPDQTYIEKTVSSNGKYPFPR